MHSSRNATISRPFCRQEKRNVNNLSYVKRHGSLRDVKRLLRFCVWNAQSVRNKTGILQDYLCQEKIDLCVVTESWITYDQAAVRVECTPQVTVLLVIADLGGREVALLSYTDHLYC